MFFPFVVMFPAVRESRKVILIAPIRATNGPITYKDIFVPILIPLTIYHPKVVTSQLPETAKQAVIPT